MTLTNVTISGNSADGGGGGGIDADSTMTLTNCTISHNSAENGRGGGIDRNFGTTTLGNTIVAGNTANSDPDVASSITSLGHNLIRIKNGSSGWISSDLTGTAAHPLNADLARAEQQRRANSNHAPANRKPGDQRGLQLV